ncbi:uncharacterized protein LOC120124432 [Hibiscus syriacus]|uniref:uncharacterized protein LOC120124432 n=1 Tax=Hibiscus syriacus TaxID=106335 RepID=UPI0019208665|nr:uncharacterized protein LOC120124432 [Hibiscus syriacus]
MFSVLRKHDQAVTIWGIVDGHRTTIAAVYGNNNGVARRGLWEHLIFVGNEVGSSSWVIGGISILLQKQRRALILMLWDKSYLARKLDRMLVNDQWLLDHPDSFAEFAAQGVSDHCLGLLWSHKDGMIKRPRPFKFFNCWTGHEKFLGIVRDAWVSSKRAELELTQIFNLAHPEQRKIDDERRIQAELVDLEIAESVFYKQKAKAHWLREGDLNTRFFHQRTQVNKKKNTIRLVMGEDGQRYDTFDGMAAELVKFFTNLIGSTDPLFKSFPIESLKDLLRYSLPDGAVSFLTKEVSKLEIKEALFRQGKDKTLGPYGFTFGFFKAIWEIVGSDFISAVRYYFQTSFLLPAFNATTLVLVPKSSNACFAKDFRPISCCSVVYKTITRILVDRLVPYFPEMISQNQTSFVKDRNIMDNTLLAQEVVREYSRKSLSPRAMGLPEMFCNWISGCITTPMYYVSLNGSLVGFFKGARGIRQDDPLSTYLFVIVMNVMYSLLNSAAMKGVFKYHPKCKRIQLTHLCFADDLLVFCHGSLESVLGVESTLEMFYELSGLKLNVLKTEFFACGLSQNTLDQIWLATGFRVAQLLVRYLRVPLVTRKLTGCDASARGARVGWNQICSLKSEGGLGLRDLSLWSKSCCLLLIRNILAEEGSLWIAWVKAYCFQSVSYWEAVCKPHYSWILLKLLRLRDLASNLFPPDSESRDHLFAACPFAMDVWNSVLSLCGTRCVVLTWDQRLSWMVGNLKGKTFRVRILKLAWTGFLYYIWEERNYRHFRGISSSSEPTTVVTADPVSTPSESPGFHAVSSGSLTPMEEDGSQPVNST